jgi:hypothetical protein
LDLSFTQELEERKGPMLKALEIFMPGGSDDNFDFVEIFKSPAVMGKAIYNRLEGLIHSPINFFSPRKVAIPPKGWKPIREVCSDQELPSLFDNASKLQARCILVRNVMKHIGQKSSVARSIGKRE